MALMQLSRLLLQVQKLNVCHCFNNSSFKVPLFQQQFIQGTIVSTTIHPRSKSPNKKLSVNPDECL